MPDDAPADGLDVAGSGYRSGMELILMIVAVILLGLAAFGVGVPRVSLGWLGLAIAFLVIGVLPHV